MLVSKYCDHQPLYRQWEIYGRQGVELERSTLAGWVGASSRLVEPLVEALHGYVMEAGKPRSSRAIRNGAARVRSRTSSWRRTSTAGT